MSFPKLNLKKGVWMSAVIAGGTIIANLVVTDVKANAPVNVGKLALARNCVATDGSVYAYWTYCASGGSGCTAQSCPPEPPN